MKMNYLLILLVTWFYQLKCTHRVCVLLKVSEVEVEEDVMINHLQTIYINIISISNTVLVKLIDARQR